LLAPDLIAAFERETDSFHRQEMVKTMATIGHAHTLDYIRDHADLKVFHQPMLDLAALHLITQLKRMKFQSTTNFAQRRRAVNTLNYFGILSAQEKEECLQSLADTGLGNRISKLYYARRRARNNPAPTMREQINLLYASLPLARHKSVARCAEKLRSFDAGDRLSAVKILKGVMPHAVEAPFYIEKALHDPNYRVVTVALEAFVEGRLAAPDNVAALEHLLNANNRSSRMNDLAADALAHLGNPAVEILLRASQEKRPEVRRAAARGLWKLGETARAAKPALQELAQDEHKGVRAYAEMALANVNQTEGVTP
jgi:hypothetical protein